MASLSKYSDIELIVDRKISIKKFIKNSISTRNWIELKRQGKILLNDIEIKDINSEANENDKLNLLFKRKRPEKKFEFVDYSDLDILYEDNHIIVINKDYNTLSVPSINNTNFEVASIKIQSYLFDQGIIEPVHVVSRLDSDTTGCMIFAKDSYTQYKLTEQNSSNDMYKEYECLVESKNDINIKFIEQPIGRKSDSIIERQISEDGKYSKTEIISYTKISNDIKLVNVKLHTGRTHQIRLHLKYIDAPIIGDFLYNNKDLHYRQLLHCTKVSFRNVETNEKIIVNAPYKEDMSQFIKIHSKNIDNDNI